MISAQSVPRIQAPGKHLATGSNIDLQHDPNDKPSKACQAVLLNPYLLQQIVEYCSYYSHHALAKANTVFLAMVGKVHYSTLVIEQYSVNRVFHGLDEPTDRERHGPGDNSKARLLRMVRTLVDPGHDDCNRKRLPLVLRQMTNLHTL